MPCRREELRGCKHPKKKVKTQFKERIGNDKLRPLDQPQQLDMVSLREPVTVVRVEGLDVI